MPHFDNPGEIMDSVYGDKLSARQQETHRAITEKWTQLYGFVQTMFGSFDKAPDAVQEKLLELKSRIESEYDNMIMDSSYVFDAGRLDPLIMEVKTTAMAAAGERMSPSVQ